MRKYVGARYCPKFVGTYDPTQEYEALSVVDNGIGTSYVSNKPVPANTPLTNTEYWTVYGTSSGAILNLQNQIDDMKDGEVEGSLQNQIDGINDEIHRTKRYLFVSDSYGEVRGDVTPYTTILKNKLDISSDNFIAIAEGSMGYMRAGTYGHTVLTLLQSSTITSPETITDIYLTTGINDYGYNASDLESAIETVVTYIKNTFINAVMHFCFIGNSYYGNMTYSQFKLAYTTVYNKINSLGLDWCDNIQYIMHNFKNMQSDKIHPNSAGANALADAFYRYIKYGTYRYYAHNETTLTTTSGVAGTVAEDIDNNVSRLTIGVSRNTDPLNFNGLMVKFADIDNGMINYKKATAQIASGNTIINSVNTPVPMSMTIDNNEMFINIPGPSFTNVATIVQSATYISSTIDG